MRRSYLPILLHDPEGVERGRDRQHRVNRSNRGDNPFEHVSTLEVFGGDWCPFHEARDERAMIGQEGHDLGGYPCSRGRGRGGVFRAAVDPEEVRVFPDEADDEGAIPDVDAKVPVRDAT